MLRPGLVTVLFPGYDPAALAFFRRLTTQPTNSRARLYNSLFSGLRAAGILPLLDCLWLMAAADSTTARTNLISSSFTLTPIAAPTFTADRGYAGDGASSYLDTGFNPSTAVASKYSLNSAHISFYDRTTRAAVTTIQMGTTGCQFGSCISGNVISETINSASGNSPSNTQSSGYFLGDRTTSSALAAYRNGTLLGSASVSSTGVPVTSLGLLSRAGSFFSSDQIAQASIGASLGATLQATMFSIIQAYMTGIGAQV